MSLVSKLSLALGVNYIFLKIFFLDCIILSDFLKRAAESELLVGTNQPIVEHLPLNQAKEIRNVSQELGIQLKCRIWTKFAGSCAVFRQSLAHNTTESNGFPRSITSTSSPWNPIMKLAFNVLNAALLNNITLDLLTGLVHRYAVNGSIFNVEIISVNCIRGAITVAINMRLRLSKCTHRTIIRSNTEQS